MKLITTAAAWCAATVMFTTVAYAEVKTVTLAVSGMT